MSPRLFDLLRNKYRNLEVVSKQKNPVLNKSIALIVYYMTYTIARA